MTKAKAELMHLVAAHKTNGLSFYQPLWSKQMYNWLFCGDCWNFSHFSRIFSYKSGLFYFHCSPIILCKALKIPLQSEMTFQPPFPLKKMVSIFYYHPERPAIIKNIFQSEPLLALMSTFLPSTYFLLQLIPSEK